MRDSRFASVDQRDAETANDPTLFRMNNACLYRWLSPDPLAGSISNPQSLNRYAYVLNNAVNLIDPLGLQQRDPEERQERIEEIIQRVGMMEAKAASSMSTGCRMDGTPVNCGVLLRAINAGMIEGIDSARIVAGFLIIHGTTSPGPGQWIPALGDYTGMGCLRAVGTENVWCPSSWTMVVNWWRPIDETYGRVLGALGKFFRGRPPGQSFGGCVASNISQTTFGKIPNSTAAAAITGIVGAGGAALTLVTTQGSTPDVQVPLSFTPAFIAGMSARILSGGFVGLNGAYYVGVGTAYGIAGVGGAGIGRVLGSAVNCAATGVTQ